MNPAKAYPEGRIAPQGEGTIHIGPNHRQGIAVGIWKGLAQAVLVRVVQGGSGTSYLLTPRQARELAASLVDMADALDAKIVPKA